jgi:hypothetical protein
MKDKAMNCILEFKEFTDGNLPSSPALLPFREKGGRKENLRDYAALPCCIIPQPSVWRAPLHDYSDSLLPSREKGWG